jgi:hypothetical protein
MLLGLPCFARKTGQCGRLLASAERLPASPLMFAPLRTNSGKFAEKTEGEGFEPSSEENPPETVFETGAHDRHRRNAGHLL